MLLLLLYLVSSLYRLNTFMPQGKRRRHYKLNTDTPRPKICNSNPAPPPPTPLPPKKKKLMGFNVGFQPYAGQELSCQCNSQSLYLMWKKNRSTRRKNHSRLARYTDRTDTDLSQLQLVGIKVSESRLFSRRLQRINPRSVDPPSAFSASKS